MVFMLLVFVASQFAMTASSRLVTPKLAITGNQAIIVIRHGEDLAAWLKTFDAQTTYWKSIAPMCPVRSVTYVGGCTYPINLTPPFTSTHALIVANELQEKINNNTLLPSDGGSTLLCWDGESLWGDDTDGSRRVFNPNSILAQLANQTLSNKMADPTFYNDFYPKKGAIVYIFTKRAGTPSGTNPQQKYNMTIYSSYLPLDGSGLGVLTWRGTWNSDNADTMPRTVTSVQLGSNEMPIQK